MRKNKCNKKDVYQEIYSCQLITRCTSDVVNVYVPPLIFTLSSKLSINKHRNVSQQGKGENP